MQLVVYVLMFMASLLLTLFSYVNRLYSERGRFLIRGSRDNVQFFEEHVEPKLRVEAEQADWTFPMLVQANLVGLILLIVASHFGSVVSLSDLGEAMVVLLMIVVLFAQVIPNILLTRTEGKWLLSCIGPLRVGIRLVWPLVLIAQFLHRLATLGGPSEEEKEEVSHSDTIEALMDAGEEEGVLEAGDRKLIQSVVEFGAKTVREVMTPRAEIAAVPSSTTLSELKDLLAKRRFTRIPVYEGDLDHIVGFVHSADLFAVPESDLERRTVQELLRPVRFVPETKRISELLQELQQQAQIAVVVDEYGSVVGIATVEDMVEEIVGEIRDEHESLDVIPEGEGRYSIPGGMDVDRLQELFDVRIDEPEATTVSGLITSELGRVPANGEVLEKDGLQFQVTESNGRRVTRLLISGPPKAAPETATESPEKTASDPGRTTRSSS